MEPGICQSLKALYPSLGPIKYQECKNLLWSPEGFFPSELYESSMPLAYQGNRPYQLEKINLLFANIRSKLICVTIFVVLSNLQKLYFSGAQSQLP